MSGHERKKEQTKADEPSVLAAEAAEAAEAEAVEAAEADRRRRIRIQSPRPSRDLQSLNSINTSSIKQMKQQCNRTVVGHHLREDASHSRSQIHARDKTFESVFRPH